MVLSNNNNKLALKFWQLECLSFKSKSLNIMTKLTLKSEIKKLSNYYLGLETVKAQSWWLIQLNGNTTLFWNQTLYSEQYCD